MTADLIARSHAGDDTAVLELVEKFKPLLKKYAYSLFYDDAYNDLLVDFIELIHSINLGRLRDTNEGSLVSYICTSIRSSYIKRSLANKKLRNIKTCSECSDDELYYIDAVSATSDVYFEYELPDINRMLTQSELSIISMLYIFGYSVKEAADFSGISRQAVNQTKKRALVKLKAFYGQAR